MESGNSGSFQSSTGDEEFDSHGDGISAVDNLAPAHVSSLANHHQQQQQPALHGANHHQQQQQPPLQPPCNTVSYMYDRRQPQQPPPPQRQQQPLENNYQRSFMNSYVLDWSYNNNAQRSETNSTELFNPVYRHGSAPPSQLPPPPSAAENTRVVSVQQPPPPPIQEAKKTRKRSRASRGAATTVLTTDTTNFRAMVQEFTGIPEPPFPSSHPFQKTRLDNIFGMVSGITSPPPPPPYLRRPFPQKFNPPFSSSSSFWGPPSSSSSNTNALLTSSLNNNYQFTPQPQFSNQFVPSFLGMKTTNQHQESREFSSNDDFGGPTGFLGLISSDQRTSVHNNNQASVRWGNGTRTGTGSNQDDDQTHVITTSAANSTNFSFSSS